MAITCYMSTHLNQVNSHYKPYLSRGCNQSRVFRLWYGHTFSDGYWLPYIFGYKGSLLLSWLFPGFSNVSSLIFEFWADSSVLTSTYNFHSIFWMTHLLLLLLLLLLSNLLLFSVNNLVLNFAFRILISSWTVFCYLLQNRGNSEIKWKRWVAPMNFFREYLPPN